jgi:hypothetical protein
VNLNTDKKRQLNQLFALNRRVMKAYLLKESLERLWSYRYEGAMLRYLNSWIDQLRWQRLTAFEKLADMLVVHLEGILNVSVRATHLYNWRRVVLNLEHDRKGMRQRAAPLPQPRGSRTIGGGI